MTSPALPGRFFEERLQRVEQILGVGDNSDVPVVTDPPPPSNLPLSQLAPTNLTVTVNSDRTSVQAWVEIPGRTDLQYEVHEFLNDPLDNTLRATVTGNTRTSSRLTGGKFYEYGVRAKDPATGEVSKFSNRVQVFVSSDGTVVPPTPPSTTNPAIRGTSSASEATGSNTVTVNLPTGTIEGDYLLAFHSGDADNTLSAPSGFATLGSAAGDGTANIPPLKVSGKVATAADVTAGSLAFTSTFSGGDGSVVLVVLQKGTFDPTAPVALSPFTRTARTSATTQTAPSVTGVAGATLLSVFATEANGVAESYPTSGPTGMTRLASQQGGTNYALLGVYSQALSAAGATGTKQVAPTPASTTNGWTAVSVLVNAYQDAGTQPPAPQPSSGVPTDIIPLLKTWTLMLPTGSQGDPDNVYPNGLIVPDVFFGRNGAVIYRCPTTGFHSANSSYPRCESREMRDDNWLKAAWTNTTGTHTLVVDESINQVPRAKPHVVGAQIHDGADDVIQIRLEANRLMVMYNDGASTVTLDDAYQLGTRYIVKIEAANSRVKVSYNGVQKADLPLSGTGWYWKVGCYVQSNPEKGDGAGQYGEVAVYSITNTHA